VPARALERRSIANASFVKVDAVHAARHPARIDSDGQSASILADRYLAKRGPIRASEIRVLRGAGRFIPSHLTNRIIYRLFGFPSAGDKRQRAGDDKYGERRTSIHCALLEAICGKRAMLREYPRR
jgi:hypothetical protein